ncbi:hypothetical protein M9H77_29346 [Catharanthus roseus]|uniref:Uncharacterized protein n=1 Tax=Catharanthus roseus TaxID=4058 RepID=A0ACC0AI00_CATRO|nr:hypothetical protein M9H77_29346 [Catharanthus roseus]
MASSKTLFLLFALVFALAVLVSSEAVTSVTGESKKTDSVEGVKEAETVTDQVHGCRRGAAAMQQRKPLLPMPRITPRWIRSLTKFMVAHEVAATGSVADALGAAKKLNRVTELLQLYICETKMCAMAIK